jgi:hypothetical protein
MQWNSSGQRAPDTPGYRRSRGPPHPFCSAIRTAASRVCASAGASEA